MRSKATIHAIVFFALCAAACQHTRQPDWMANSHHTFDNLDSYNLHTCPHVGDMNELC